MDFPLHVLGSQFIFKLTYKTVHGTGTGEIGINIGTVDGFPVGKSLIETDPIIK